MGYDPLEEEVRKLEKSLKELSWCLPVLVITYAPAIFLASHATENRPTACLLAILFQKLLMVAYVHFVPNQL